MDMIITNTKSIIFGQRKTQITGTEPLPPLLAQGGTTSNIHNGSPKSEQLENINSPYIVTVYSKII